LIRAAVASTGDRLRRCLPAIVVSMAITACASTGHNFDQSKLAELEPGRTSYDEAANLLTALPVAVYRQSDGTMLARWEYKLSYVADGMYSRKDVTLQFGPDARLLRLVDSTNIRMEPWLRKKLLGTSSLETIR
jgi:hypothetical protein